MIDEKLNIALDGFLEKWKATIDKWYIAQYPSLTPPNLKFKKGKKYIKITKVEGSTRTNSGSVEAFINMLTGDIYKSASCSAPAKHARGNLFSDDNGMEAIDLAGYVRYLRG